jgi:predicted metal-dependent HD superfamily phosphohydrolase
VALIAPPGKVGEVDQIAITNWETTVLPPELMEKIKQLHCGPERGYHSWSHPQALLNLLPAVRHQLNDPLAVECAIVLHDAIYEPARNDNEKRSAALAKEMICGVVPDHTVARVVQLIEATERHLVPENTSADEAEDCRIFLDMDLSVLGSNDEEFDAYETGVRHEYRHIPEVAFKEGRATILERFLNRDRLYMSEWGHKKFEIKARENLLRSLRALRGA